MSPELSPRRPTIPFEPQAASATGAFGPAPLDVFLFEIAWEVCNQVGGIYQVLRSKAPLMTERWRDQYCLVGPYVEGRALLEFEPLAATGWLGRVVDDLGGRGLKVHHGRWLVAGKPRVLLLAQTGLLPRLGQAKFLLWQDHGIESPAVDPILDAAVLFGEAVQELLSAVTRELSHDVSRPEPRPARLIAHFHEWQAGLAIANVRRSRLPFATVFTTHATQLGRYIASNEEGFYDYLEGIDQAEAAARYNVRSQHGIERACAHGAHVLTTVSAVTRRECAHLLGREPDLVTPNALTISRYNVGHDFQTFHADFKERLHTFTMGYFFPSYSFELDSTLYMFTSGRYEPRNKGFDMCLDAMAQLNARLKAERSDVTVVFFIITPRPVRSLNPLVLEKRGVLNELHEVCENIVERVGRQLFHRAAKSQPGKLDDLVEEYWQLRFRRTQAAFRMNVLPPVVTHILEDDHDDAVLSQIRRLGLINRAEDPVKVVYHPEFISSVNPLWGIEYEQFVRGCHLGLFPSAYEPWGYTPLECMALGTPAITSDLSGFGRYVQESYDDHDAFGLSVLSRRGRSYWDATTELTERLVAFTRMSRRDRVTLRNEVEKRSWDFDWSRLGASYHEAHDLALARGFQLDGT